MEEWKVLENYDHYSISNEGRVRSDLTNAVLAVACTPGGRAFVKMRQEGHQVARGLALLVCEMFVRLPKFRIETPTPIHLDGDPMNCRADNLVWRSRWFAMKYTAQFDEDLGEAGPIRDIKSRVVYRSVWDVVHEHGLLFVDVVKATTNKTYVSPTLRCYEWVNPE